MSAWADAGAPELEKLKVALDSGGALSFTPVVRDYLHNMSILCSRRKERRVVRCLSVCLSGSLCLTHFLYVRVTSVCRRDRCPPPELVTGSVVRPYEPVQQSSPREDIVRRFQFS